MPGFVINGQGGPGPANTVDTLRNHRWLITNLGPVKITQMLVARDLVLPSLKLERQEVLGGLIWYKYAKAVKWDDLDISFYDNGIILKDLETWRDMIFTNEEGIKDHSPSSGYKKECEFVLIDGTGNTKNKFTLKGAWPAKIGHSQLSYTNNEIKLVTATMAYDWAESVVQE